MIELYIGLSEGGWAINGQSRAWARHDDPVQAMRRWAADIEAVHTTRWRKASIYLWLSGGLARPFLCGPVDGLAGWHEAEGFAASLAADATGQDGPHRVVLEAWPGSRPALAIAMTKSMADAIEALRAELRIVWRSLRPRWARALNLALESDPSIRLFALAEPDAVTVISGTSRDADKGTSSEFEHASTYAPVLDAAEMTALWHRVLLSRDVAEEHAWLSEMLTLPTPIAGRPDDASGPSQRPFRSLWGSLRRQAAWPPVQRLAGSGAP